jgi:putative intracellular protease/amidase
MQKPVERFGQQLMDVWGFTIDEELTAVRQLERMGFDSAAVSDIIISHLDVDHAGGLRDFPNATVHLAAEELANLEAKNPRYLFNQFEHRPKWKPYVNSNGSWFALEARSLQLPFKAAVKLVFLPGHTRGHSGIAIEQSNGKWFLHAADTYYRRVELLTDDQPVSALSSHTADDNNARIDSIAKLRRLVREHDEVAFCSTHDVLELPSSIVRKVLVVTTSNDQFKNNGHDAPTGVWFEEFAVPYMEMFRAGVAMTVASPKGGAMPIDPRSAPNEQQQRGWQPALVAAKVTRRLAEMRAEDFDAIFLPGGHGPMFDLPNNAELIDLLGEFERANKIIAAVCHGPAGLLNAKRPGGKPLVADRTMTAYTAAEEVAAKLDQAVPFILEDELKKRGAKFVAGALKADHVERDGTLITGQNPASSASVARELIASLKTAKA